MSENNSAYNGAKKVQSSMKMKLRSFALKVRIFVSAFVVGFFAILYFMSNQSEVTNAGYYVKAQSLSYFAKTASVQMKYKDKNNKTIQLSAGQVLKKQVVNTGYTAFKNSSKVSALIALGLAFLITYFVLTILGRAGKSDELDSKLIRGSQLVDENELAQIVKNDDMASHLKIGNLPILKNAETQQIYISGAIGCGKGNAIKGLLDSIIEQKQKFIIYDKSGEYVSKYYREGIDVILNPFDARMPYWSPWLECKSAFDFELIASSFLPDSPNQKDEHWTEAPRSVFADLLLTLKKENENSIENLFYYSQDKNALYDYLAETPSAQILDPDSAEHASSVLSILTPKIKALRYLTNIDSKETFSIRDWVNDEATDRRVFITCSQRQKKSIQPLMTAWLDIVISEILSLPEDRSRRLFSIIDELASLDPVNSLYDGINEGRKFGLCHILSVTSMEAMKEKYGDKKAKTIIGMCSTKINYRCDEPETAKWLSDLYGEEDVKDEKQSLTISNNNDSTNMHDQRTKRNILLPTEFMDLPDMLAVVKLGKAYPIAKVNVPYKPRPDIAKGMIIKEFDFDNSQAEIIEEIEYIDGEEVEELDQKLIKKEAETTKQEEPII